MDKKINKIKITTNIVKPSGALNAKKIILARDKERYKEHEVNKIVSEVNDISHKH